LANTRARDGGAQNWKKIATTTSKAYRPLPRVEIGLLGANGHAAVFRQRLGFR